MIITNKRRRGMTRKQAYNAIAVSRQMKLLALNSSKTSRENSAERELPAVKEPEVRLR